MSQDAMVASAPHIRKAARAQTVVSVDKMRRRPRPQDCHLEDMGSWPPRSETPSSASDEESRPVTPTDPSISMVALGHTLPAASQKVFDGALTEDLSEIDRARKDAMFLHEPFVHRALVQGKFKTIVLCPKGVDKDEWIAVNLFDMYNNVTSFFEVVSDECGKNCSAMSTGPGADCLWRDQQKGRPAIAYFDSTLDWMAGLFVDKSVFPFEPGRQFSPAFPAIAKRIFSCLANLFAHLYFAHFTGFAHLGCESHLNSMLAHFLIFGRTFELISLSCRELNPLDRRGVVLGGLLRSFHELGIVPKELIQ